MEGLLTNLVTDYSQDSIDTDVILAFQSVTKKPRHYIASIGIQLKEYQKALNDFYFFH